MATSSNDTLALQVARLKSRAATLQSDLDQAAGAFEADMKRIQDTFGYSTLEEAQAALESKAAELSTLRESVQSAIDEIPL